MANTTRIFSAVALGAALASSASPALAQSTADAQVEPTATTASASPSPWGRDLRTVTLDEGTNTLEEVLKSVAAQAGFGLALTASQADLAKPVILVVKDRPANEVLDILATSAGVTLEMRGGILIVSSKPAWPVASAPSDAPGEGREGVDRPPRDRRDGWFEHGRFGSRRHKRVEVGGSVTVEKDEHLHSAVSIGGTTTVFGHLDKDAVAVGGPVIVKSGAVVEGKAVAVGGAVIVETGAVVEDEAVSVGKAVEVADGAVVQGDRVSIPVPLPPLGGIAGAMGGLFVLHLIGALIRSVVLFGLALLLIWLIPRRVETVQGYLEAKMGISILSGFLIFLALVPLIVVLAVTIIGIPLIPVAVLSLAALVVLGLTGVISWLGHRVPVLKGGKTPVRAVVIGFIVFAFLNIIPVLGGLFLMMAVLAGAGAAFQSRFGGRSA